MLENMFARRPRGNYDRLLDFSRAVTGSLFFVPSASFLDAVPEDGAPRPFIDTSPDVSVTGGSLGIGSLGIGSLKGELPHE
jgi:putative iron-dependent peroxidase